MARKLRVQYPGAIYHVMSRCDHRERIFLEVPDRKLFPFTLKEACQKTVWQIHTFCLMSNHFHLVIETRSASLVEGMKWWLGVYTKRFHARHKLFGHLFSGRYKALLVEGSGQSAAAESEALRAEGITAEHLALWRKGHPLKVRPAVKLRQETTANAAWTAERLGGSRGHLMHLLQRHKKAAEDEASQQRILKI